MRQLSAAPGAVAMRAKRRLHRERKLCQQCPVGHPRSARPGKATCVECSSASNAYRRKRNRERAATSACQRCGLAPREVGVLCMGCDKKRRGYPSHGRNITSQRRREHGLCRDGCGRSAFDRTRCKECSGIEATKRKAREEERVAKGLCYRCGKNQAPPGAGCGKCVKGRRSHADRRKFGTPIAFRRCGACGGQGHTQAAKRCPLWKSSREGRSP